MTIPTFCYEIDRYNNVSFRGEPLGLSHKFNILVPGGYKSMRVLFLTRNPAQATLVWISVDGIFEKAMVSSIQDLLDHETFTENFRDIVNS